MSSYDETLRRHIFRLVQRGGITQKHLGEILGLKGYGISRWLNRTKGYKPLNVDQTESLNQFADVLMELASETKRLTTLPAHMERPPEPPSSPAGDERLPDKAGGRFRRQQAGDIKRKTARLR